MYIYPSITFDYLQFGLFLYAFGYEHDKDVVLSASARNAKPQSSALSIVGYIYIFFIFYGLAARQINTYKRIL